MLNWIEIWGMWRPSKHLKLVVVLLKPFLNHFLFVAQRIILLKRGHSPQGILFPWKGVRGLQQCLGSRYVSKWHPHGWHYPRFPSRILLKASHCLCRLALFPQCILVSRFHQVSDTHAPKPSTWWKENVNHRTRLPSSNASSSTSNAQMPIVGAFGCREGSAWEPWPY